MSQQRKMVESNTQELNSVESKSTKLNSEGQGSIKSKGDAKLSLTGLNGLTGLKKWWIIIVIR